MSAFRCPTLLPDRLETLHNSRLCPAERSSASPHWPQEWLHQCQFACPQAMPDRQASQAPRRILADVSPHRSNDEYGKSWSDRAFPHPMQCPQTDAGSANPSTATRCRVQTRCPRNNRSSASGNRSPALAQDGPASRRKILRTTSPRMRRIPRGRGPRSDEHKTGDPDQQPYPYTLPRDPLVAPDPCVFPSP